jgi:hypothetical protein
VVIVVEPFDDGPLDRAVHPLDLTIRPGMLHLGQPVFDTVVVADAVEDVLEGMPVLFSVGELDATIDETGVDGVGNGADEVVQEPGGSQFAGLLMQFRIGKLRGFVDGHKEIELAFCGGRDRVATALNALQIIQGHERPDFPNPAEPEHDRSDIPSLDGSSGSWQRPQSVPVAPLLDLSNGSHSGLPGLP